MIQDGEYLVTGATNYRRVTLRQEPDDLKMGAFDVVRLRLVVSLKLVEAELLGEMDFAWHLA